MTEQTTAYWHEQLRWLQVVVIVPTYNNGTTLAAVLQDIRAYAPDIIVVNDGSTDHTAEILSTQFDLLLIAHHANKGKGSALKDGLRLAREKGFRYAITIDSDGQHFASDIPRFVEEIKKTPDALLVGARDLAAENMPGKNTFANKFSNFWYRLQTGNRLTDTQSGYRLYPVSRMGTMRYYTSKYEFELEAIVFAAWKGINVRNIPIGVYYPPEGERVSHFRPLRDFTRISILNTVLVLMALLWIWPRDLVRKLTWNNTKRFFDQQILNSPESNQRMTMAVMLGIFMGIVPVWGYQMLATLVLTRLLRLNTVIAIVAANISIPPMIPVILYGSYLTGCWVLGRPTTLNFADVSLDNLRSVIEPYLVGSIVFAAVCSLTVGLCFRGVLAVCRKGQPA